MKLGLGLYRRMLTTENFRFAKQAGATHIVAHLTVYFGDKENLSTGTGSHVWGVTTSQGKVWSYDQLNDLRKAVNAEGLELAALENFDPSHWFDVLLDGPRKTEQMEGLKTIIRNVGKVGIPCMGYYFSVAGVWGRTEGKAARGEAKSVGFHREQMTETPILNGTVWNMIYDPDAPKDPISPITQEEMWHRLTDFLTELVPVAEEVGIKLASHPDDPPLPTLRGAARLIYKPELYQKLLDTVSSPSNALEFCVGTIAEMNGDMDVYEAVESYGQQGKIAYVHFRNVVGKVPDYDEVFLDEGDVDMFRVLQILRKSGFDGVLIPDHTPQMTCEAPWYAGMAYALGWMRAALAAVERM
jgi:mannonate dehydratase